MCKYCELKYDGVYDRQISEYPIADSKYEECRIVLDQGKYVIRVCGSMEDYSEPIKYCPFCGKELM